MATAINGGGYAALSFKNRSFMKSSQTQLGLQFEWMDLKTIQLYACVSEKTIREWIHLPNDALPAVQVEKGKIFIKRSTFDRWLESHAVRPSDVDLDGLVAEVLDEVRRPN